MRSLLAALIAAVVCAVAAAPAGAHEIDYCGTGWSTGGDYMHLDVYQGTLVQAGWNGTLRLYYHLYAHYNRTWFGGWGYAYSSYRLCAVGP